MPSQAQLLESLHGHSDIVTCLSNTPSDAAGNAQDDILLSGSKDGSLFVWRREDGKMARTALQPTKPQGAVTDCAMSRFGDYAVSASADKKVRVWDVSTAKEFRVLEGHSDTVTSCAISEDSRSILTGSLDKTCRLWNTLGRQLFQINVDFSVVSLKMSPDQPAAFVATKATIERLNLKKQKRESTFRGIGTITCLAISPDGTLLASVDNEEIINLWDTNGNHLYSLDAKQKVFCVAFCAVRYVLFVGTAGGILGFNLEKKNLVLAAKVGIDEEPACHSVAVSAHGDFLYGGYTDKLMRVWDLRSGIEW